ncbi:S-adenosyl-L-methionine-dependent methyltransferase [Aspergillus tetrazonus]
MMARTTIPYNLSSSLFFSRHQASRVESIFHHRLALAHAWDIPPASRILDMGCGQGEPYLLNAAQGHIMGIDSAPPDYGGPYTVEQSQRYIKTSKLGHRIDVVRADLADFFHQGYTTGEFDVATFCHSLWYFPSRESIFDVFKRVADTGVRRLCLAEYSLRSSRPEQMPHVLATQAQALFHTLRKSAATRLREPNVRTALTPAELLDVAAQLEWRATRSA